MSIFLITACALVLQSQERLAEALRLLDRTPILRGGVPAPSKFYIQFFVHGPSRVSPTVSITYYRQLDGYEWMAVGDGVDGVVHSCISRDGGFSYDLANASCVFSPKWQPSITLRSKEDEFQFDYELNAFFEGDAPKNNVDIDLLSLVSRKGTDTLRVLTNGQTCIERTFETGSKLVAVLDPDKDCPLTSMTLTLATEERPFLHVTRIAIDKDVPLVRPSLPERLAFENAGVRVLNEPPGRTMPDRLMAGTLLVRHALRDEDLRRQLKESPGFAEFDWAHAAVVDRQMQPVLRGICEMAREPEKDNLGRGSTDGPGKPRKP